MPEFMKHPWSDLSFIQMFAFFSPKIVIALICGGLIGLERELKHKAAGMKTNMLIAAGSALYTALSLHLSQMYRPDTGYSGDPGRVAAQIVSGIGFLGGGAIIQARGTIVGLTTAATIWVVAAIGICAGVGYYSMAFSATFLVLGVLMGITWLEQKVIGRVSHYGCEILVYDPEGKIRHIITGALDKNELHLEDFDLESKPGGTKITLKYKGHHTDNKKFLLGLWALDGIKEVKQS